MSDRARTTAPWVHGLDQPDAPVNLEERAKLAGVAAAFVYSQAKARGVRVWIRIASCKLRASGASPEPIEVSEPCFALPFDLASREARFSRIIPGLTAEVFSDPLQAAAENGQAPVRWLCAHDGRPLEFVDWPRLVRAEDLHLEAAAYERLARENSWPAIELPEVEPMPSAGRIGALRAERLLVLLAAAANLIAELDRNRRNPSLSFNSGKPNLQAIAEALAGKCGTRDDCQADGIANDLYKGRRFLRSEKKS